MGTWFSDKYAEGTVGHRFYAGCQNVDTVEALAAEHARELFGAEYAYVQPHSGIDANLVAFWSILAHRVEGPALEKHGAKNVNELTEDDWETLRHELGNQRMLGMSLDAGGHLTHGFRPNISGKMFHQRSTAPTPRPGCSTTTRCAAKAREFQPLILVAGYSAYPRRVNFAKMREIADEVGADADGRHGALRRPGGRQGLHRRRGPGAARPRHHHHDPQVAARPARRAGAGHGGVRPERRPRLPDGARRPALARDGRQGGRARRGPASRRSRPTRSRIADNAKSLADGFLTRGANLVTGGTDNHIVLLDVSSFGLTGRQAESALLDAGVVTNRNSVPADPNGAWYTSGIRLGTPALTTRGFGHDEFDNVAELIVARAVEHPARHHQGGRAVEGVVHAGRRGGRQGQGRVGRDARQAPALPGLDLA